MRKLGTLGKSILEGLGFAAALVLVFIGLRQAHLDELRYKTPDAAIVLEFRSEIDARLFFELYAETEAVHGRADEPFARLVLVVEGRRTAALDFDRDRPADRLSFPGLGSVWPGGNHDKD